MQTEKKMKTRGCGVVPLDILEERVGKGVTSALGEVCTIREIYGVTEEEFKLHQLTLSEVEENAEIGMRKESAVGKQIPQQNQKLHQ